MLVADVLQEREQQKVL